MDPETVARLRCKIGEHELEVEGPTTFVVEQMDRWAKLAGLTPPTPVVETNSGSRPVVLVSELGTPPKLEELFTIDPAKKLIVPRVFSPGRRRNPDAALMILYGYRHLFPDMAMVPRSAFQTALAASGCRVARLDKVLQRHLDEGRIRRAGTRARTFYALTFPGEERAAALVREFYVPK